MADTAQSIVETVLRNLGNLSISVFGQHATDMVNAAYLERAQGRSYRDFRELQATTSFSVLTTSGTIAEGTQSLPFSGWAADIWVPVSWRDRTNNRKLQPASINDFDDIEDIAAAANINQYAIWGNNLVITPAVSVTTVIGLRYITAATKFVFSATTATVTGTSVLPAAEDVGVMLRATERFATIVNPALVSVWAAQFKGWRDSRISPVDQEILEEGELTAYVDNGYGDGGIY